MAQAAAATHATPVKRGKVASASSQRTLEILSLAKQQGLLDGGRTLTVRGRMPSLLIQQAKSRTGIQSDSKLLEAALASIAVADDYGDWLLTQRSTVSRDIDLEF
jgi:hypothetical protein